jgi:hypothetical protein
MIPTTMKIPTGFAVLTPPVQEAHLSICHLLQLLRLRDMDMITGVR